MYDLNLLMINHSLVKSIQIVEAAKRMVGKRADVWVDLNDIGREVREAAAECQRVLELIRLDGERALCDGDAQL